MEECGKKWICSKCRLQILPELKFLKSKIDKRRLLFVGFYEGKIRNLLLQFKFQEKAYIANFFAQVIKGNERFTEYLMGYDYVIPVPMHKNKKKCRGYNQAELLTKEISKAVGVKCLTNCLVKIKDNKIQSKLNKTQRKENVKGSYKIVDYTTILNKKILLIDDIYTTGSTAQACIKELQKAKPEQIDVLVMAKTK